MSKVFKPGNIWSGNRDLAPLTNPTELAFMKKTVRKHYHVKFRGIAFEDAEEAFNAHKVGLSFAELQDLCTQIIVCKFQQYPHLHRKIRELGGRDWLKECWHFTFTRTDAFKRWEGVGIESAFIRCLIAAYDFVADTTPERVPGVIGTAIKNGKVISRTVLKYTGEEQAK